MKKVLILYGAYGGGHLSAAKTISKHLETTYKDEIQITMLDCIEYINKYVNKVSTEAYKELAKKEEKFRSVKRLPSKDRLQNILPPHRLLQRNLPERRLRLPLQ